MAEDWMLLTARDSSFRKAVAYFKRGILALVLQPTAQLLDGPEQGTCVRGSDRLGETLFGAAVPLPGPPVIHWAADNIGVHAPAAAQRACAQVASPMARYFIFERLESGRLLWMSEAEELEEAEAKLQSLIESNPGSDYFAFDVETGTKVRIESHNDPI